MPSIVYDYISGLFSKLTFTKIEHKNEFAIYSAKIRESCFVLVFVPSHLAFSTSASINELHWTSIQTRSNITDKRYTNQRYQNVRFPIEGPTFKILATTEGYTTFGEISESEEWSEFELILINTKKTRFQYNNKMKIDSLLETYNCIIKYTPIVVPTQKSTIIPEQIKYSTF